MDGVEVARQLFLRWQIRSLFVSANSESYRANAAAARPLGFLSKPVPALELKAALAAAASELQSR
jgi:CheY-like chemotaxis protein